MINDLVREGIKYLVPYDAAHFENVIKLDANENPYPFPEEVLEKVGEEMKTINFSRYPDPWAEGLRSKLAEYTGVSKKNIMLGNGSDELIQLILLTFGGTGQVVITPPTFVMYKIESVIAGVNTVDIPLKENFQLDWDTITREALKPETKLVFICSPNNPTGNVASLLEVEKLIQQTRAVVVLDEAYYEFAKKTGVSLLDKYQNLIVLRTFSKAFGMAGLRVGYLLTSPEILKELAKVKPPYNLNTFSQRVAEVVLDNLPMFQANIEKILQQRKQVYEAMQAIKGVEVFPTEANFILFRTLLPAEEIYQRLLGRGILIRNMSKGLNLNRCLRVTIGTEEENKLFLQSLKEIVS